MNELLQSLLSYAASVGASDIHIKADAPVVFRLNRELVSVDGPHPTEAEMDTFVRELLPENLRESLAKDHEADFALSLPGLGRFRFNIFRQRGQWTLAARLVKTALRSFEELQLPPILGRIASAPRGIILVAGAIGSGKSTTLAAMINHINTTSRRHIITLEDPIEFLFEDKLSVIEQREVGIDTQSYATGLRHVLRQDPDVLVIGEMRDAQSAAAAMTAANIGHLVISTLHTADAPKSIQRILEFFPGDERDYARRLFAETLYGVVCQRLIKSPAHGMIPALEILLNNSAVAKLITSDRMDKIPGAIELGEGEGMQTFDACLKKMADTGRISAEDALAHAGNPEALRMAFKGLVLNESRRILGARE